MDTRSTMPHCNLARRAVAIPLSVVLATGCTPLPAFAADGAAGAGLQSAPVALQGLGMSTQAVTGRQLYSAYLSVLLRAANGLEEFADSYEACDSTEWAPTYFLFDLGYDGTPELMVRTPAYAGSTIVRVYTYESGAAVELGSYWEWTGKSAGNASGSLYVAGWNKGSSYVNEIRISNGNIASKYATSGKATDDNPTGEIQVVNQFLDEHEASWLTATAISDYSTLESQAKFALPKAAISVEAAGAYTGSAKTPGVTVTFAGKELVEGSDYRLEYANNVNAGTATATVTGLNEYQGSLSGEFAIGKADIASASVSVAPGGVYTGAAKTPAVSVQVDGAALVQGASYAVSYDNNVNAGTATATVTGQGNYQGSKKVPFTIARADISTASVTTASAGAYTGAAKTPAVSVRLGNIALPQGTAFKVSYANNVNAGSGIATVTGQGNYQGTRTVSFAIGRADIAASTMTVASGGTYSGAAKTPAVSLRVGSNTLAQGSAYTVSYASNVNAGTATAIVTGQGNYQGTKRMSFSIAKADIAGANVSVASAGSYTGSLKTPALTVQVGSIKLTRNKSYSVTYKNNKNAGTATAVLTGSGNFKGTKSVSFKIDKAANPMSVKTTSKTVTASAVAKAAQKASVLSFSKKAAGKVTYKNVSSTAVSRVCSVNSSTGAITVKKGAKKGSYTVKMQVHAAGDSNHVATTKTVSAKVTVK